MGVHPEMDVCEPRHDFLLLFTGQAITLAEGHVEGEHKPCRRTCSTGAVGAPGGRGMGGLRVHPSSAIPPALLQDVFGGSLLKPRAHNDR